MDDRFEAAENLLGFATLPEGLHGVSSYDFTKSVLIYASSKFQLLPELVEVLSLEDTFKLLYAFSGQVIQIPDQIALRTAIRDLGIFYTVKSTPTLEVMTALANQYGFSVSNVRRIVEKVAKTLEQTSPLNP